VKCAQCGEQLPFTVADLVDMSPLASSVTLQTARGKRIRMWFCDTQCAYWGGALFVKSGAPTTVKALRKAFAGRIEVLP
jgi:hypothetical protein